MAEFKIATHLPGGKGGKAVKLVQGELLCGGVFGIHDEYGGPELTHIPTGRSLGRFRCEMYARRCANELIALSLPWSASTQRAWNAARDKAESKKAIDIIERWEQGGQDDEAIHADRLERGYEACAIG